ncbi:hypothetical protein MMC10_009416 [Thelotrema lepadinum]|nr:hypothetical protein [Thelotrema lepadinum]
MSTTTTTATATTAAMADSTPRNMTPPDSNNSSYSNNSFDNPLVNPAGYSPASPQSHTFATSMLPPHAATRQIHPPRSPLYVPAVLRPTEKPINRRPLTPPRSMHSSTDSLAGASKPHGRPHTPSQPITIITALTRSSTASSGPTTPTSLQPTRDHWKPDCQATHCDAPGCSLAFSFLTRRHHCRRCGGIFCAGHASQQVPLDEQARLSEDGGWQRACDTCFGDWVSYTQGLASNKMDGEEGQLDGTAAAVGKSRNIMGKKKEDDKDAAASVPKDWSWSTF